MATRDLRTILWETLANQLERLQLFALRQVAEDAARRRLAARLAGGPPRAGADGNAPDLIPPDRDLASGGPPPHWLADANRSAGPPAHWLADIQALSAGQSPAPMLDWSEAAGQPFPLVAEPGMLPEETPPAQVAGPSFAPPPLPAPPPVGTVRFAPTPPPVQPGPPPGRPPRAGDSAPAPGPVQPGPLPPVAPPQPVRPALEDAGVPRIAARVMPPRADAPQRKPSSAAPPPPVPPSPFAPRAPTGDQPVPPAWPPAESGERPASAPRLTWRSVDRPPARPRRPAPLRLEPTPAAPSRSAAPPVRTDGPQRSTWTPMSRAAPVTEVREPAWPPVIARELHPVQGQPPLAPTRLPAQNTPDRTVASSPPAWETGAALPFSASIPAESPPDPWPALPVAEPPLPDDPLLVLRAWERRQRLDQEQRGHGWSA